MSGPILAWYIEKVVQSINNLSGGIVEIEKWITSIEISEGYNALIKGSDVYLKRIGREAKEDGIPNLKEVTHYARQEAIQEYKHHSSDAEYLALLGDFMDMKENVLNEENNKILDLKNIGFLKNGTEELLRKMAREKMDEEAGQREIDQLVDNYKANAVGDNKYEILTNYLKYLNAAVYK